MDQIHLLRHRHSIQLGVPCIESLFLVFGLDSETNINEHRKRRRRRSQFSEDITQSKNMQHAGWLDDSLTFIESIKFIKLLICENRRKKQQQQRNQTTSNCRNANLVACKDLHAVSNSTHHCYVETTTTSTCACAHKIIHKYANEVCIINL